MPFLVTADTRLRVYLSSDVVGRYLEQAEKAGVDVEQLLSDRLAACVTHTAAKPIYFNDAERQELEKMLGKNIVTTKDLLAQIRNAISVRIGTQKITLKPGLLSRLKTRCLGMRWEEFLEKIITEDLERYAGMR